MNSPYSFELITVSTTENTTESYNSITNTFHNIVDKRNPYKSKNLRWRPEPTPSSLLCPPYNISVKENEGNMLVSLHASTVKQFEE